jgi:hypothetical protein
MVPLLLAQIFTPPPPIINIAPAPKQPWYESAFFLATVGFCVTWFITGVGMTAKDVLAHVFFGLSWICGSLSLWIVCKNVFQRNRLAWWILMAAVLGIALGRPLLSASTTSTTVLQV